MKNKKIILWTVIISFILSLILIQLVSKKLNPSILRYSTIEAKRFGTYVVNFSLDKEFLSELDNDIFKITKNDENEIQMIDFDVKKVNNLLENVTTKVQNRLIMLENGKIDDMELANTFQGLRYKKIKKGVVCELPAGILYSNALLSNNGPVVPIKLNFIGYVTTNIETEAKTYGINSVYLEIFIHVEVIEQISMPLLTKSVKTEVDIPLTIKIIQGVIPDYYQSGLQRDSQIYSLPIE